MLRLLISLPILLVFAVFALSNPQPVRLGLWPTDLSIEVPLSLGILVGVAAAFFLGALLLWTSLLGARLRARRAEHQARLLEAQVAALKTDLKVAQAMSGRAGAGRELAPLA